MISFISYMYNQKEKRHLKLDNVQRVKKAFKVEKQPKPES